MISITIDIMCDGVDCMDWIHGSVTQNNILDTEEFARKKAANLGWTCVDGQDYCPECSKKIKNS